MTDKDANSTISWDAGFNTASGMRSHVTVNAVEEEWVTEEFQYRKRYEVTCDITESTDTESLKLFQYRKRYEVTCDLYRSYRQKIVGWHFNTASGMRSHVTCSRSLVRFLKCNISIPQAV